MEVVLRAGGLCWPVALRGKRVLSQPWGQTWPYLACSQEGLVALASVQVLLCLVGHHRWHQREYQV